MSVINLITHYSSCYHPSFPVSYFPWLCVWDVCYITSCYLLHIYSGKIGNLFLLLLCSLWWVQIVGYVLTWRTYLFICTLHHLIIIIVQTYLKTSNSQNACQIYFVKCVSKIKHILSVIHYTMCGTVCFQFTHFPYYDWENIYTLSYLFVLLSSPSLSTMLVSPLLSMTFRSYLLSGKTHRALESLQQFQNGRDFRCFTWKLPAPNVRSQWCFPQVPVYAVRFMCSLQAWERVYSHSSNDKGRNLRQKWVDI